MTALGELIPLGELIDLGEFTALGELIALGEFTALGELTGDCLVSSEGMRCSPPFRDVIGARV